MKIKSTQFIVGAIITFIIIFLMNYIGNPEADKLSRALLTATAGVIGLGIGLYVMNRFKNNDTPQDFD